MGEMYYLSESTKRAVDSPYVLPIVLFGAESVEKLPAATGLARFVILALILSLDVPYLAIDISELGSI